MTKFINGPAAEKTLMLRRSPIFLRVTIDEKGNIDALDQIDDIPSPSETFYVYKLTESRGAVHIQKRGGGGGFFPMSDYTFIPEQPPASAVRIRAAWITWCETQPEATQL